MTRQLPTPSPEPTSPAPAPTLPAQINAATRKEHTELNRLIVDRLPLALRPKAFNPALLGEGLAAFFRVYYTFEAVWDEIASSAQPGSALGRSHDAQLLRWLATPRPKGLTRTPRMENDQEHTFARTRKHIDTPPTAQKAMLERMRAEIQAKPHILIAYSWVMYMAIFSGGRWIRQQLANAGLDFWTGTQDYLPLEKGHDFPVLEMPGFSFLSFDGEQDGEDIKALFKARLAEAETLLTQQERQDVVVAAKGLFEDCIDLVGTLDRAVWWQHVRQRLRTPLFCIAMLVILVCLRWSGCL